MIERLRAGKPSRCATIDLDQVNLVIPSCAATIKLMHTTRYTIVQHP